MDNSWGSVDAAVELVPIEVRVPPGYWRRDDTHLPLPLTPLSASVMDSDAGFGAACAEFGLLVVPRITEIGGWWYTSMQPVGAPPDARTPPGWLLPWLLRLSGEGRKRMRRSREVARTGFAEQVVTEWHVETLPGYERRISALRDTDLTTLDIEDLARHLEAVRQLTSDGWHTHFRTNVAHLLALGELSALCRGLLGWGQPQIQRLFAGLSFRSTEPARKLRALAGTTENSLEFNEFAHVYGCRSMTMELADPTLGEVPGLLWSLLRDRQAKGYHPEEDSIELQRQREEAAAEARAELRDKDLASFDAALDRMTRAYPIREDNVFFTLDAPNALCRYAALEAGERLAGRGQIDATEDVFFLRVEEVLAALRDGEDRRAVVTANRGRHEWALANPGPRAYGREAQPPSTRWLREDLRVTMESMLLVADHVLAMDQSNRTQPVTSKKLTGVPGAPGRYRGPVRMITSERDFDRFAAGDVLVCRSTRPSWSVLFPAVGAIVTDAGGALSHPAIIAREYRIPAVVATGSATSCLRDGQIVTVHGDRGIVEVES
ncbi:PEP-utilizing enzyme [Actinocrispum sp. NPDC049592]|uniref:PEP-utilizing enzyme n=1 Tax=Actinocrispum sp. NPDC049592 TaxID=3154835 RepID=UPI00341CEDA7